MYSPVNAWPEKYPLATKQSLASVYAFRLATINMAFRSVVPTLFIQNHCANNTGDGGSNKSHIRSNPDFLHYILVKELCISGR